MSNFRNRARRPARTQALLDPKPTILVFCEGQNTEPQYIEAFRRWCRNPRVQVEISKERGVPLTLVTSAKERKRRADFEARRSKDDNLAYDEVWCVFDVDEHPKLKEAQDLANAHGIRLAISNPCFELWLLLHFRENPGAQHRHDMQKMLGKFVPGYDKHVSFELFAAGYSEAVKRARRLDERAREDGDGGRNPTTDVYQLTESIRQD